MLANEYQSYSLLRAGLMTSLTQQLSGTFLIATQDNASCRFALERGRLTHCSFSRLHGEAALIAFTTIQAGRHSFNDLRYPFRTYAEIKHERAVEILNLTLPPANTELEEKPKVVRGSQFTQAELERLFGKFYFE